MKEKVLHLHFKEPYEGQTDMYFGSYAAIYQVLPRTALGICETALSDAVRKGNGYYENKRITLRLSEMHRAAKKN